MSERKLLFFDIDGTLMDFDGNVPPSAVSALARARENGHITVLCSGRATYMFNPIPEICALCDGRVASTGALVIHRGKTLFECYMPLEITRRAMQAVHSCGGIFVGQGENELFFSREDYERCWDYFRRSGRNEMSIEIILRNARITENINDYAAAKKALYYDASGSVEHFTELLGDVCDITAASFHNPDSSSGEITLKGINKSFGMQKYLDAVGLSRGDCIAFGDGPNDFDMLEFAGTGIAMGNANDDLKAIADYVTDSVERDGIEKAMKALGLI